MSTLEEDFYAAVMIKLEHLEGKKRDFPDVPFLSKHQKMADTQNSAALCFPCFTSVFAV